MTAIADARERERALDPRESFIVQAPAGSGKTGLLIQRILRLLATVDRPEEILAITFTRKAAAEMRRRVLQALAGASCPAPAEANERVSWQLAREALARDRELGWDLADNAARLRIQTIDSLCAALARQMPVLSRLGAMPAIVEDARALHREAAQRTLARLESGDAEGRAVRRLLHHLDGDWGTACTLLQAMLARRDQWLRRVAGFDADGGARAALEAAFCSERARMLGRVAALMPAHEADTLLAMARFAAGNLAQAGIASPIARLRDIVALPPPDESGADDWLALASLCLVADGAWRVQIGKRIGFPPGKGEPADFKERMRALLERLCEVPGLCEALHALRGMPPAHFSDAQWDVLGAVVATLPHAAAQLRVLFAERGEIDFAGLAEGAVAALGDADAPTDLLLALDLQLRHVLVDEFQDTSLGQWDLLTRLTAGWCAGDGRTAFLVGDPMQSIYRFREADVALFQRAWHEGLPGVALTPLRLAANFRSQAGVVQWVNGCFARVLSRVEDPDAGAVPYTPCVAQHPPLPGDAVRWHAFVGEDAAAAREAEARSVARLAQEALAADPSATAAVLVRNRSHLDRVVPALREQGIRFRAVDIEPLSSRPVVQDLMALTRALGHLADRVAWLALLRAPWCGLTAAGLHLLCGEESAHAIVWDGLHDAAALARLDEDSAARVRRLVDVLAPFVHGRSRGGLRARVEAAWLALGAPACLASASDLEDAETFFVQLEALEDAGELPDPAVLDEHLQRLHAAPDTAADARLQLMTIHKSKGLEFDTVIVPGLDRAPREGDRPLFVWKARSDGTLMMAPVRAAGQLHEPAYDYLRSLEHAACEHEVERLFYVAATRAAKRLHLLGFARADEAGTVKKPSSRSLLGKAWGEAQARFLAARPLESAPAAAAAKAVAAEVRRVAVDTLDTDAPAIAVPLPAVPALEAAAIEFSWVGETARHVGTITHRWLQRIGTDGVAGWNAARVDGLRPRIERELARRGVPPAEREAAKARVVQALQGAITDPRGRWILTARADARCEYRLRVASPDGVRLVILDRHFTDERGGRWIVDYKTSAHEGGDLEAFLDRELDRYSPQLARYRAALAGGDVSLGLYFPLVRGWREQAEQRSEALLPGDD